MRGVYFEVGVFKVIRYVDYCTEIILCTYPGKMAALKIEILDYSLFRFFDPFWSYTDLLENFNNFDSKSRVNPFTNFAPPRANIMG